jgi:hypothetical protein
MTDQYQVLISMLEDRRCWGIRISAGGMTFEIGSEYEQEGTLRGDFTVWVRTRFRVVINKEIVLRGDYPVTEQESEWTNLIDGKTITRASIDPSNNSLRLLLGADCLLSVFPSPAGENLPWVIFENNPSPPRWLTVYQDLFDGPLAERGERAL